MHNHCINKLLNIEDVIVKKVIHADSFVKIHLETKASVQTCPACGSLTKKIHDYRLQTIKDLPFQTKHCYLVLRKRRYTCSCGKRFYENYSFLPRYFQRTSRLTAFIADALHDTRSVLSIAQMCNVSASTVYRILETISFSSPKIPQVLSIDEFKGNANGQKYQCILVDPLKRSVLDILPSRSQAQLTSYFKNIHRQERFRVKFFVCDMWLPYTDLAKTFFPNATIVIDKFHVVRYVTWALENVRKRIQKLMHPSKRK